MCHFCSAMHRYTNLLWDPSKRTILGKNGVSWLSITLGSLVVILCIGILAHCISEVRKSRQESDDEFRKTVLVKNKLLAAETVSNQIFRKTPVVSIKRNVIVVEESEVLAENYDDIKESAFLLRNKRETLPTNAIEKISATSTITFTSKKDVSQATMEEKSNTKMNIPTADNKNTSANVKDRNETAIRLKRQFDPDYTDRTPIAFNKKTVMEKLFKRENAEDNKSVTDRPVSSTVFQDLQKLAPTEKRSMRHISNRINNLYTDEQTTTNILPEDDDLDNSVVERIKKQSGVHFLDTLATAKGQNRMIKDKNETAIRSKRQLDPDYTDKTPIAFNKKTVIEKLFKRENPEDNKSVTDGQDSSTVFQDLQKLEPTEKRSMRYISNRITNFNADEQTTTNILPEDDGLDNSVVERTKKQCGVHFLDTLATAKGQNRIIEDKNETVIRSKRQLDPDYTDKTPISFNEKTVIEKLFKRENAEDNKSVTDRRFRQHWQFDSDYTDRTPIAFNEKTLMEKLFKRENAGANKNVTDDDLDNTLVEMIKNQSCVHFLDIIGNKCFNTTEKNPTVCNDQKIEYFVINMTDGSGPLSRKRV